MGHNNTSLVLSSWEARRQSALIMVARDKATYCLVWHGYFYFILFFASVEIPGQQAMVPPVPSEETAPLRACV